MHPRTDSSTGLSESLPDIHWGKALAEHAPWLRTVIRSRLNEPQAVDDVMQEVALGVLKSKHRPTDPTKIAPWLYRVSIKQCLMYRRSAGRRRKLVDRVATATSTLAGAEPGGGIVMMQKRKPPSGGKNVVFAGSAPSSGNFAGSSRPHNQ